MITMYEFRKWATMIAAAAVLGASQISATPSYAHDRTKSNIIYVSDRTLHIGKNGKNTNVSQYLAQVQRRVDYKIKRRQSISTGYRPTFHIKIIKRR